MLILSMGPAGSGPGCRAESIRGLPARDRELVVELSGWSGCSLELTSPPMAPVAPCSPPLPPPIAAPQPPIPLVDPGHDWHKQSKAWSTVLYAFHLLFKCPSKTYLYTWLGIGKISTAKRHQGIQGFVTHDPFPHLPSGCPNSNWNQISCFLRQDWRQGRRNSDRR